MFHYTFIFFFTRQFSEFIYHHWRWRNYQPPSRSYLLEVLIFFRGKIRYTLLRSKEIFLLPTKKYVRCVFYESMFICGCLYYVLVARVLIIIISNGCNLISPRSTRSDNNNKLKNLCIHDPWTLFRMRFLCPVVIMTINIMLFWLWTLNVQILIITKCLIP